MDPVTLLGGVVVAAVLLFMVALDRMGREGAREPRPEAGERPVTDVPSSGDEEPIVLHDRRMLIDDPEIVIDDQQIVLDEHNLPVDERLDGVFAEPGQREMEPVYEVYESDHLIDVDHLPGMNRVRSLLAEVTDRVVTAKDRRRRRRRRPTSILLHGPRGGAMTVLAHLFSRGVGARVIRILASRTLPVDDGGSQPLIAPAVREARQVVPSVLVLDELEQIAHADITDPDGLRATHDLLNESLSQGYGPLPVVIAMFASDAGAPPLRLAQNFEHTLMVDVPELERALAWQLIMNGDPNDMGAPRQLPGPSTTWGTAA
jgi:hypothetical protein